MQRAHLSAGHRACMNDGSRAEQKESCMHTSYRHACILHIEWLSSPLDAHTV